MFKPEKRKWMFESIGKNLKIKGRRTYYKFLLHAESEIVGRNKFENKLHRLGLPWDIISRLEIITVS